MLKERQNERGPAANRLVVHKRYQELPLVPCAQYSFRNVFLTRKGNRKLKMSIGEKHGRSYPSLSTNTAR